MMSEVTTEEMIADLILRHDSEDGPKESLKTYADRLQYQSDVINDQDKEIDGLTVEIRERKKHQRATDKGNERLKWINCEIALKANDRYSKLETATEALREAEDEISNSRIDEAQDLLIEALAKIEGN